MLIPKIVVTSDNAVGTLLDDAIASKTKTVGGLGRLESLAYQIGLIQQTDRPQIVEPHIMVFAGDHGIVEENVSVHPQNMTWKMVENFLMQGAAVNVFARQNGCRLQVIDAGVNYDFGSRDGLTDRKIDMGTRNFAREPAMTAKKCVTAIRYGMGLVDGVGGNVIGFGEIGIGNTVSAAALMHKLTDYPVELCVGGSTAASFERVSRNREVVERAVLRHADVKKPLDVLAAFGGYEIAMMVGAMLRAAERRMVLMVDGFIVAVALLVAAKLEPHILDYCVFAHRSEDLEHRLLLDSMNASPLLQLDIRTEEGSGAALAMPLLHAAVGFLKDVVSMNLFDLSQTNDYSRPARAGIPNRGNKPVM